jgi:Domain of unknown function (DUF4278)
MQLIYRGTTFNYDPAERAARRLAPRPCEGPYELMYRGTTYRIDPMAIPEPSTEPAVYELRYRGTTYQMHRNEQGKITAIASFANSPKDRRLTDPQLD